ncbi:MAG: inner membrane CreD family protein [Saprospirales bacterium]|nr:inner membrane CreD family protein [Saprospirales bacterium]
MGAQTYRLGITGNVGDQNSILDWGGEESAWSPEPLTRRCSFRREYRRADSRSNGELRLLHSPKINGSHSMEFEPGRQGNQGKPQVGMAFPSFEGAFSPSPARSAPDGFSRLLNILDLNRNYPKAGRTKLLVVTLLGVRLIKPIDEYMKNERSAKYSSRSSGSRSDLFLLRSFGNFTYTPSSIS